MISRWMTDEEAELKILGLANHRRKFALGIGYSWSQQEQAAFERGIDREWWTLVDLSPVATPASQGQVLRIFRLTDAGLARLAELSSNFNVTKNDTKAGGGGRKFRKQKGLT